MGILHCFKIMPAERAGNVADSVRSAFMPSQRTLELVVAATYEDFEEDAASAKAEALTQPQHTKPVASTRCVRALTLHRIPCVAPCIFVRCGALFVQA